MIRTKNLRYSYDGVRRFDFPDIDCQSGETLLILGKSGVGKTTFLHLLGGLLKPEDGSVEIGGNDIAAMNGSSLDRFRGNHIGIVFQKPHFIQSISIAENLILAQRLGGRKKNQKEIPDILNRLGIGHRMKAKPSGLSQGELQRAGIARALINEPDVLLADEPTSALDDENTNEVSGLISKMAEERGSALLIVTHDQRLKDRFSNHIELQQI